MPTSWKITAEPANSGRVILYDSTCLFKDTPSTGTAVGTYRYLRAGKRFDGTTYCTDQAATVKMDYLVNGAWSNISAADVTATADTVVDWTFEPQSPDYRIYVLAGATAPTLHESSVTMHDDLEA